MKKLNYYLLKIYIRHNLFDISRSVIRFPANFVLGYLGDLSFGIVLLPLDASTVVQGHSSFLSLPSEFIFDFSSMLTTTAFDSSRLRWFEACS
jgi:hypothetical protein